MDYSKWDEIVRQHEEEDKRVKDEQAANTRRKFMKDQALRQAKWREEHKDEDEHAHHHSHSCGFGHPDDIRRAAAAKKRDEIPLEERNVKKVRAVEATREHGKLLFGEGKYEHAAAVFDRGLLIINGSYSMTDEQQEKLDAHELVLEVNLAACMLKLGKNRDAIRHCKAALSIDKDNAKALYRWSDALVAMGELEQARQKSRDGLTLCPGNAGFRRQLANIKKLFIEQRRKVKEHQQKMRDDMALHR